MKVQLLRDVPAQVELEGGEIRNCVLAAGNIYEIKIILNGPAQAYFPEVREEETHLSGPPNPQFELPFPAILLAEGSAFTEV